LPADLTYKFTEFLKKIPVPCIDFILEIPTMELPGNVKEVNRIVGVRSEDFLIGRINNIRKDISFVLTLSAINN
jgi:hypothetical protein